MSPKPPQNLVHFCFFLLALLTPAINCHKNPIKHESEIIRGMFVFGSSLVDNGNNNFLPNSLAKVDYFPYGIDFPFGPSGRFTNGRNVIDVLGQKLKLPSYIPPFTDPSTKGKKIWHGVNYASGGSGILDDTGVFANVISLNQQIRNFEMVTLPELEMQMGKTRRKMLPKFLFVVGSGGNDYSLNYFMNFANTNISIETFTTNLTTTLSHQLKKMYKLGARKFVLLAINPNGCSPMATARDPTPTHNGCIQSLNRASHLFNFHLKKLVDASRHQMPASNIIFVNSYKIIRDIIKYPSAQGFRDVENACCEIQKVSEGGTGILCQRGGSVCRDRNEYVYFDGLHPTEAVNVVIANKAFESNLSAEVYPFNVNQLSNF